jgi:hypothetical protein
MAAAYKNGTASEKAKAEKFLATLQMAKDHNIYEAGTQ